MQAARQRLFFDILQRVEKKGEWPWKVENDWPQKGAESTKKAVSSFGFYAFFCGNRVFSLFLCGPWPKADTGLSRRSFSEG
jgi:hypothetical protein